MKTIFVFLLMSCVQNAKGEYPIVTGTSIFNDSLTIAKTKHDLKNPILGIDRLHLFIDSLKNKRIAVVGNQTSVVNGKHLVDTLLALNLNVVKVFSPEHGFRGDVDAGEKIEHSVDAKTGIPLVSLYGNNKKPTAEQLENVDIVIYDIQDVGVRFYTFISTLHYVMEACAENKKNLVVLDRPNPNAHYVDGPILESEFKSFVGMHPVPIVYGMTIGEYDIMINGEKWLANGIHCDLWVIPCKNYKHKLKYSLPIAPSPNLRTDEAIALYPSLCLFEATTVSIGRGT
ncbi:MAG: exo-beta-N-acetylmuramidase NamZ family protein, partial [Crocinitomicaceae bacterium]